MSSFFFLHPGEEEGIRPRGGFAVCNGGGGGGATFDWEGEEDVIQGCKIRLRDGEGIPEN